MKKLVRLVVKPGLTLIEVHLLASEHASVVVLYKLTLTS